MFGLGDNESEERVWNMVIFKVPMTDKELEDASPVFCIIMLLVIIAGILVWMFS